MKSTLLILIGYITCTLKCEMNKTEAKEKTDYVKLVNHKDQQVHLERPEDANLPENVEATAAVGTTTAAADGGTTYIINTTAKAAAVGTTYAAEQPDRTEQPADIKTTDTVDTTEGVATNTTYVVEQPDGVETTDELNTKGAVNKNTTYAVEQPDNTDQPEDGEISDAVLTKYAVVQQVDTEQPEDVEKTEATKKQERQSVDTGPSKIKVEDALKILEKSKKKYTIESIALIKKLEWLRSTFNITELMIDHKIDPNEDFVELSDTGNGLNSSNILRRRVKDGFLHVKNAIMKISKFEPIASSIIKKQQQMVKSELEKRYKANFVATHNDRDKLKKIHLADLD